MQQLGALLSVRGEWTWPGSEQEAGEATPAGELRVTGIHDPPYLSILQRADGSFGYSGYLSDLWEIIARELRLRYRIQPLLDGGYGSQDENGTWTGLVGELVAGRADVALTWLIYRPDRAAVIDYIDAVPVDQDQYTFYVAKGPAAAPQLSPGVFRSLLQPLHWLVWWTVVGALLAVSAALYVTHRREEVRRAARHTTWGACLLASFMTVVNQSWESTPRSLAGRAVTLSSWVLGMLIYFNYTANLISHLTVTTVGRPISSLREFSEQDGWLFSIEPGMGVLNDWQASADAYERELHGRTVTGRGYVRLDVASTAHRSVEPRVLTYIDVRRMFFALGSDACVLVPLFDQLPRKSNDYMVMAKGRRDLLQAINRLMQVLNQAGTVSRLKRKWLNAGQGLCTASSTFKEMTLTDVLAVLLLVPLAAIFSLCICIIELAYFRIKKRGLSYNGSNVIARSTQVAWITSKP